MQHGAVCPALAFCNHGCLCCSPEMAKACSVCLTKQPSDPLPAGLGCCSAELQKQGKELVLMYAQQLSSEGVCQSFPALVPVPQEQEGGAFLGSAVTLRHRAQPPKLRWGLAVGQSEAEEPRWVWGLQCYRQRINVVCVEKPHGRAASRGSLPGVQQDPGKPERDPGWDVSRPRRGVLTSASAARPFPSPAFYSSPAWHYRPVRPY